MRIAIFLLMILGIMQLIINDADSKRLTVLEQYVCRGMTMDTCKREILK